MRLLRYAALLLPLMVASAHAAPGVNIRWDNCFNDGGLANKTFACNTNVGVDQLDLSFVLANTMADVAGQDLIVEIRSANATLPSWWTFKNPGSCRTTSFVFVPGQTLNEVNCVEWSAGQASGGIGAYTIGSSGPNSVRMLIAVGVEQTALATLNAGTEYISGRLSLNHLKTVGTGACTGCNQPVCLFFNTIQVTGFVLENNVTLTTGANGVASQIATWQDGSVQGLAQNCGPGGCFPSFSCIAAQPTAARSSTWGAVKSLYR